jgi:hypothetical protein
MSVKVPGSEDVISTWPAAGDPASAAPINARLGFHIVAPPWLFAPP